MVGTKRGLEDFVPKIVDHGERRRAIAEATALLIASIGIEQVSVRRIERDTGFSKGVIQHYFSDKAELLTSALDWANQRYMQREHRAVADAGATGLAALEIRLENLLPFTQEIRQEWKIRLQILGLATVDSELAARDARRFYLARNRFAKDLRIAKAEGELRAGLGAEDAAQRTMMVITGTNAMAMVNPTHFTRPRLRQIMEGLLAELRG
jgi:AcrR family transcriptional regulator